MGRSILTEVSIRRVRPPAAGRVEVWDAALPGFGLRVTDKDRRSFVLLTRVNGKAARFTLGRWPVVTLAQARQLARDRLHQVGQGVDPREAKRARRIDDALAFERVAADFIEKWSKLRKRTWQEDERIFAKYVTPRWQGRRLDVLGRRDVVALLDVVAEKHGPIMANRVLAAIKTLMSWALNRGLLDAHPVAGLTAPAPELRRDRVLSDAELRKVWPALETLAYPWGTALQLLLLTGARRGEVAGMRWEEVDMTVGVWSIPTERAKNARPQLVPLAPAAVAVLEGVPRFEGCPLVFSSRPPKRLQDWSGAQARAQKLSETTGWTVHDFRRTVRTGLARLGVASDVGERVLGHAVGGVRGVYDRHDYLAAKRDALDKWAAHVSKVVGDGG